MILISTLSFNLKIDYAYALQFLSESITLNFIKQ